jgi:hypothetical protein
MLKWELEHTAEHQHENLMQQYRDVNEIEVDQYPYGNEPYESYEEFIQIPRMYSWSTNQDGDRKCT